MDHVHPDEVALVAKMVLQRAPGDSVSSPYETVLKRSDGTSAPSELITALITYQGSPAVLVIIRDISERKHIEQQLRQSRDELGLRVRERTAELEESRQRCRDPVELLPEMIFETDVNGRFTYANQRALNAFGYTQEDLEKGIRNLDVVTPAEGATVRRNASRILAGASPMTLTTSWPSPWAMQSLSMITLAPLRGTSNVISADTQGLDKGPRSRQADTHIQ